MEKHVYNTLGHSDSAEKNHEEDSNNLNNSEPTARN